MLQKELNKENVEITDKAYELYEERGHKDGNDVADWLDAEKRSGEKDRSRRDKQMRSILWAIVGILCVIVAILLATLFKKGSWMGMTSKDLSDLKVMMLVLDPRPNEKVVALGDTHFDFDQSILTPNAKMLLDADVKVLKENPSTHVRMAGYTSAMGTDRVNQTLSEDRADRVRDYLVEKGIAPGRISIIGYGKTRPALYEVEPGNIDSKEAKANMRVLFEVIVR